MVIKKSELRAHILEYINFNLTLFLLWITIFIELLSTYHFDEG